ncbi:GIY-YIG nuclease family protein [Paeniclostridium hominis]|uniref:GIY-YIG nuclease family protein n=1 Tax=Paeniclostridium hominis TaxID=2764329 RepID=UPI0022E8DC81|nr:GIY-YIG nuclease family protein [Paeniclostridium hominis]
MFKSIKELVNLKKSIEEKKKELNKLEVQINNKESIVNEIKESAYKDAELESEEIIKSAKNKLEEMEYEISKKDEYIKEAKEIKETYEKISKKVDTQERKLSRIKSIYKSIQYILEKYDEANILDVSKSEFKIDESEYEDYPELNPTVQLKLHSMDLKELRKSFNDNEKFIKQTLERYESRYTTKTNATIYKLMVIALKAEQQNILYNLKYDKLEKSIEDVKKVTEKFLNIASKGNQSIVGTITKFIGEIEYLFIKSIEIEYEYYVKKEKQKEEQARLREQIKQEAEERRLLEQQKKQVEKEEEKYKLEIEKVEDILKSTDDEEKLKQLNAKIEELKAQLGLVEEKKEDIVKLQNGKAGYVYVISNLGSFGDKVFKVGMTRRLNPQDRINELGGASVPFTFDVHSFIFSDDAVGLEQKLHNILDDKRVNKINLRKEFFNVSIDEIERLVQDIDPSAEFNTTMVAEQYRQTLSINEDKNL